MNTITKLAATACGCLLLTACANKNNDLYHWGEYQKQVRVMYVAPEDTTTEQQIDLLLQDIQQAENNGKAVPPGLHIHLGMLYARAGKIELSKQALMTEKDLFPESATLVDTLLNNQNKGDQS